MQQLTATFVILFASIAAAAEPQVNLIEPPGMQRGTEVDVVIHGAQLADAEELLFYEPGVTVKELAAEGNAVKAKLAVAPECEIGIHALRVRSKSGVSNLWTFSVGALPVVAEAEPNSDFAVPQAISLDSTVQGVIKTEDVDYFVVEAKQGERITAELEGMRLGITMFDPYVAILNTERFELARSDDTALLAQDPVCSIIAPADGKYIVQVRDSAFQGDDRSRYLLHVGRFPRPTAAFPPGGKPGETLEIQWLGDVAGPFKQQVTLPADLSGPVSTRRELVASNEHGVAPSPNPVEVGELANAFEAEPNDGMKEATVFTAPAALAGVIGAPGDIDRYKFVAKKDQTFDIRVLARQLRSPLDSVLRVRKASGQQLGSNDDDGQPDSRFRFTAPEDGEYIVEIQDHLKAGGPDYVYRVEVAPPTPSLTLGLPERQQYIATTLAVPRGGRMALLVTASRQNFGGELNLAIEGLPQGMSVEAAPMAADRSDVPVLFSAPADAPLSGALADLQGRPVDENLKLVGHLRQRTMLVRGQNNRDMWGHDARRMAAVVTEEAPFSIEIVQPKAPLVRDGSMQLKVIAQRKEGFTAPIAVSMLYNPPGVGSSGTINIAEGATEAVIPLTANGSAVIRNWKIAVTGRAAAPSGGGAIEVSSQLADLEVADRFFDIAFEKAAVEQGQPTEVVVKVAKKKDFPGAAKVELLGLPQGTTSEPREMTHETTELVFPIATKPDARVGIHKSLVCRSVITIENEPVTTTLGTGELRIDQPLPPKKDAPPKEEVKPEPAPAQPVVKRLSRLEQLRKDREEAKK